MFENWTFKGPTSEFTEQRSCLDISARKSMSDKISKKLNAKYNFEQNYKDCYAVCTDFPLKYLKE